MSFIQHNRILSASTIYDAFTSLRAGSVACLICALVLLANVNSVMASPLDRALSAPQAGKVTAQVVDINPTEKPSTKALNWKQISNMRKAAFEATQAGKFDLAETQWSELIKQLPEEAAIWSNRGNVRVRQNDLDGAMADYTKAITLAPNEPDPYLNRGAVWEAMGQWENAITDYNRVLQLDPDDPAAYNNRGNAEAGRGDWELAIADYQAAITLQPSFSLAYGNYALALYQTGEKQKSLQIMKSLVRKYPSFADMRAALTAALWEAGQQGEAESNWVAVVGLDTRYKNLNWVANVRRWPPKMVSALDHFLNL